MAVGRVKMQIYDRFTASLLMLSLELSHYLVSAIQYCEDSMDCGIEGYICQDSKCICEQRLFTCLSRSYGDKCRTDQDCSFGDKNLVCVRNQYKTCKCRRNMVWDVGTKRCYLINDNSAYGTKFDPVQEFIIPCIVVVGMGAMLYLGLRLLFCCNCKIGRRRRRNPRFSPTLVESQPSTTWVASYRVFSSAAVDSRTSPPFPPCILLPVGPPPYEEALKHKVILSSMQPISQQEPYQPQVQL